MKRRALVFLTIGAVLLGLLPAAPVGAATGSVTVVRPDPAVTSQLTSFANGADSNIVRFNVKDDDLNVNGALKGAHAILGTADGTSLSITVPATLQPVNSFGAGEGVFDLQTGTAYAGAQPNLAGDSIDLAFAQRATDPTGGEISLAKFAAAVNSPTAAITPVKASAIKIMVTDASSTATTTGTIVVRGTKVDPVTLVETADATESVSINALPGVTDTQRTSNFYKGGVAVTIDTSGLTSASGGFTWTLGETRTLIGILTFGLTNDTDTGAGTTASPYSQTARASAGATSLNLTLRETSATSKTFQNVVANWADWSKADDPVDTTDVTSTAKDVAPITSNGVALIDAALLAKINARKVLSSPAAYQFVDATDTAAVIAALNTSDPNTPDDAATTTVDESKVKDGADWAGYTAGNLGLSGANANTLLWKYLMSITLPVAHADTVTLAYTEATGELRTKTLTVDSSKPTVADISPADAASISNASPVISATVADAGTGFTSAANITLTLDSGNVTFSTPLFSTNSVTINASASGLAQGTHTLVFTATDKVGNAYTKTTTFTVDTSRPVVLAAATGIGIKASTDATTTYDYVEFKSSEWIKATMSEKVSEATTAGAFDIAGSSAPASISIQKKVKLLDGTVVTDNRAAVYLKAAAALDPAIRPVVKVSGTVNDLAGNSVDTAVAATSSATPADNIAPTLTVALSGGAVSGKLAKGGETVTVTVTSDEDLPGGPSIKVNGTARSVTAAGTRTWTATFAVSSTAGTGQVHAVTADGTDAAQNPATQKTGTFQGDPNAPTIAFTLFDVDAVTAGNQVETEDVLFVTVNASDADVYTTGTDTYTKVTIASASLETLAKLTAAGATAEVATATRTLAATGFQTTDSKTYVVGLQSADLTALANGFYRLKVTGSDEAGNAMATAASIEFQVVDPQPKSIAITPGWSLVSIPGRPQNTGIASVLTGTAITQVWGLDPVKGWQLATLLDGEWVGTLTSMTDGRAYFVRSTTVDPIKVLVQRFAPDRTPPQYSLTAGWNGIGFTPAGKETSTAVSSYLQSLGTAWGALRTWSTTTQSYVTARPDGSFTVGFPTAAEDANGNGICGSPTVVGDTRTAAVAAADLAEDTNGNNRCDTVPIVEAGKGYLVFLRSNATLAP